MKSKYALLNELLEFIFQKCDEAVEEAFEELIEIYEDDDNLSCFVEIEREHRCEQSYLEFCIAIYKEDHQDD